MSTGFESTINDGSTLPAGGLSRSIAINFAFPLGYTQPLFSTLEFQYSRRNKVNVADTGVSTSVACGLLPSFNNVHVPGSGIFLGGDGDAQRSVARFDIPDAAIISGADYVDITIFDPANPEVSVTREIQIVHTFGKTNIDERSDIDSDIGTIPGGTPGDQQVLVLFTVFGNDPEELGPEIIGSYIGGQTTVVTARFLTQILGSYYYDQPSNTISQIRGSAVTLGITAGVVGSGGISAGDILTGVTTENGSSNSGYTFLLPPIEGFTSPGSFQQLTLIYAHQFAEEFIESEVEPQNIYPNGCIVMNTGYFTNTNTVLGTDGTMIKPVTTMVAALNLARQTGAPKIMCVGRNIEAIDGLDLSRVEFIGIVGEVTLQCLTTAANIQDTTFRNIQVNGKFNGSNSNLSHFYDCIVKSDAASDWNGTMFTRCGFETSTLNMSPSSSAPPAFIECYTLSTSQVTITIDSFSAASIVNWKGQVNVAVLNGKVLTIEASPLSNVIMFDNGGTGTMIISGLGNLDDSNVPAGVFVDKTRFVDVNDSSSGDVAVAVWNAQRATHVGAGTFGEYAPANVTRWAGSATIDGKTLTAFAEIQLAYTNGRFRVDFPNPGDISFYKQDNTTVLYTMQVTAAERTRL